MLIKISIELNLIYVYSGTVCKYTNVAICLSSCVTGIDWEKLPETEPPQILPYLPAKSKDDQALTSDYNVI